MVNRRKLLQLAFALPVTTLAGCGSGWNLGFGPVKGGGGSGSGDLGDFATRSILGTLSLPESFPIALRELRVETMLGGEAVGAGGSFRVTVSAGETSPTLAYVRSGDNALLLGFVSEGSTLSIRSTAIALLYFALGGYTAPTRSKTTILSLIEAHPAVGLLTETLTARLLANPLALNASDPAIGAALKTATDALLAERPIARGVTPPTTRHRASRAEGSALLLTEPSGKQSNLELVQGSAPQSIVVSNHARRYCQVYVYETGNKQKGGATTTYDKAKIVTTARLTSTAALSITGTLFGAFSGTTAGVPISINPIELKMATGADKTTFETIILGSSTILSDPPLYSDPRYASEVEGWRDTRALLNTMSWLIDVVMGLLFELWGISDLPINAAEIERATSALRRVQIRSWRRVGDAIEAGNGGQVLQVFLELCTSDSEFFRAFVAVLAILNPTINKLLTKDVIVNSQKLILKLLLAPLNVVGVILGLGDIGAVLWDLANTQPAERWSATLFTSDVTLSPSAETIEPGDSLVLTAHVPTVPGTANLRYKWNLSGSSLANLSDSKEGKAGASFETTGSVVTLATTPSTQGTLTVTVEATETANDGRLISHGQAQSQITVNDDVPFGMVKIKFNGSTYLLPRDDVTRLSGTTGLALGATYQRVVTGGIQALKLILEFPTKTVAVGTTARIVDSYNLTLELPSTGGSQYFAPAAPGTLTITEAGTGYFAYTLSLNLKGLRGVPITGPATLKGWVTGY